MDRISHPKFKSVEAIHFVNPTEYKIGEHFSLFHLKEVPNETCRIDFYFDAGKCLASNGIPSFANGLLLSGTEQMSSNEIQEAINTRGGFFSSGISMENATVTLHCLHEKAAELIEIISKSIQEVSFFQKEIDEYLSDQKQKYQIGLEKVSFLAQKTFQEKMFHSENSYNEVLKLEDFNTCTREQLIEFHASHYKQGLSKVAVVGNMDEKEIKEILNICSALITDDQTTNFAKEINNEAGEFYQSKDGALQSAIRIGRQLFNKQHDDYLDFLVLNTILGDYFGSKLMRNIREDKGYTYGVGSALVELSNTGYFVIGTEVGKDVRNDALSEIKKEIELLRQYPVPETELDLVRNYMLGQLLKSADGPYAMMDLFLSANINGMSLDIYNRAIQRVKDVSSDKIMELANKYLQWEELSVISAG